MRKKAEKRLIKVLRFLTKAILYYPFKGAFLLLRWLFLKIKEKNLQRKEQQAKKKVEKQKPKTSAKYDGLKEILLKKGSLNDFESKLFINKSTIGLILGARGTGKSALGMRLLENFHSKTNKKAYALGFKEESLPCWIKVVIDINQIENDAVILIDEGGIEFSSRNAMSSANKILSEILLIARHKDLSVIFITQNSSNLEINAIRQADYLLLKPSSLLQMDFERKKIQDIYREAAEDFEKMKGKVGLTYVYADNYRGFVTNTLPSFWGEKVSKGYANKKY
ncbi:MAG: zonular occludens toxin domain-containing protein [Candidatus Woesearchaeota archaeon]